MNDRSSLALLLACLLGGCAGSPAQPGQDGGGDRSLTVASQPETTQDATSTATTIADYKRALAERIAATNSTRMFIGRPQALLRSVIVVKYQIDASGKLIRSDIMRSNRDRASEATALSSLKAAAPFPKPGAHLLRHGRVEVMESWLFNNDGRFQLRTTAETQMDH